MSPTKKLLSMLLSVSLLLEAVPQPIAAAKDTLFGTYSGSGDDSSTPTAEVTLLTGKTLPVGMEDKVTMPSGNTVPVGTKIGELSSPDLPGFLFEGWYYDEYCTDYAYPNDVISEKITLYASFTDRQITRGDDDFAGSYTATMDLKDPNFKFRVTVIPPAPSETDTADSPEEDDVFNLDDTIVEYSAEDIEKSVILRDQYEDERIRISVKDNGDFTYDIEAQDGFEPGKVYQLDISNAAGLYIVADGITQPDTVIYHNMSIYRDEVMDIALDDNILYIPAEKVSNLGELEPLLTVEVADLSEPFEGMTALEEAVAAGATDELIKEEEPRAEHSGSFVYKAPPAELPKVGDMVCVYAGTCPTETVGNMDNFLNEDKASYMVIDRIEDYFTFYYHMADPMDVFDSPIVVPLASDADLISGDGNRITLPADAFSFAADEMLPFTLNEESITYGSMELDENTVVEAGDYLSIYMVTGGNVSESNLSVPKLVRITKIAEESSLEGDYLTVNYTAATMEELQEQLQVHAKQNYDVSQEFIDEHKDEIDRLAQREFAATDKTPLLQGILQDESVQEDLLERGIDMRTTLVLDKDRQILNTDMLDFNKMGLDFSSEPKLMRGVKEQSKVTAELKQLTFDTDFYRDLTHFKRSGVGFDASLHGLVEVTMDKFTLTNPFSDDFKNEGNGKINIEFSISFTQEMFLDENFDVSIKWKWFVIPVDIKASVSIDVGSWSNVTSNLKVSTSFEDDPFDMDDYTPTEYTKKYMEAVEDINKNIIPQLKDAKEALEWDLDTSQGDYIPWEADEKSIVEHIQGDEDEDPTPKPNSLGAFEEAYKKIVDGVDDTWMPILKLSLLELKHSFLGVICVKLELGLTLNICGTIEIGMEYNYDYIRRYTATFYVSDFSVKTSSTDIQKPHSTFSLYAIGVFGFKPAIYLELAVGLLDTDLDSISITVEAGIQFMLYLYGYLNIDNWKDDPLQFQGGIYLDEKFVLDISLGVQVGKGALGTSKQIYGLEVPLTSLGSRFQIRGLAEETGKFDEDDNPLFDLSDTLEVNRTIATEDGYTFEIPKDDRMIFALDMRTGDVVPYYPEPNEFKYEVIGDNQLVEYTPEEQKAGKIGKGVITYFSSTGTPAKFDPLTDDSQDYDQIKTAEVVNLDFEQNQNMSKFNVDIKMTYIPPKGVMVKGRQYTKILHYTVDQSVLGKNISYQKNVYDPELGAYANRNDGRFDLMDYMPTVEMLQADLPENRNPHITGYTFKGWKPYVLAYKFYQYNLKPNLFLSGKGGISRKGIGPYWAEANDEDIASAFLKDDDKTYLRQSLRYQMIAEPNPQKLKVRHFLINPEGTGYDLVGEQDAFTADGIVSDAKYNYDTLKNWGAVDAFNAEDEVLTNRYHWFAEVKTADGTQYKLEYTPRKSDMLDAIVTATDSETAVDSVDIYFTERSSFYIKYVPVDENGVAIPQMNDIQNQYYWNDLQIQLDTAEYFNQQMYGYEFDGWYDTSEFDELSSKAGDPSGTKRMPLHDITVYFKVKSLPLTLNIRFICDEHKNLINSCQVASFGGDTFTYEELMKRTTKDGKCLVGDLFTSDREILDNTSDVHRIGGSINRYYVERNGGTVQATYCTKTIRLSESKDRPEDLKIRVVFKESKEKHMKEGEEYVYAIYDFGTEQGCGYCVADSKTDGLSLETAPFPAGYYVNGFSHEWELGPYRDYSWLNYYYIPTFMASHLEETDWTHYDAATNTLTYTFYSWLDAKAQELVINHWLELENGRKINYEPTHALAATDEVVDIFPQYYYEVVGCETDYERTPKQVTITSDDVTVVDYYLKPASYNYQFIVKEPDTGKTLFTSDTYTKSAHGKFSIPSNLRADTGENDALNLAGYRFVGWFCPQNGNWISQPMDMHGRPSGVSMDIKVTAENAGIYEAVFENCDAELQLHWDDENTMKITDGKYRMKYPTGSSCYAYRTVKTHTDITLPEPQMRDGAVFLGWYDNPEYSGSPITGTVQITENTSYYARVAPAFTVTFVGNGDITNPCDFSRTFTQSYGQPYVFPPYTPSRNNYTFEGWSTTADGTVNITADSKVSDEYLTLYAVWQPNDYHVYFELEGGTWNQPEALTHTYGESTTTIPTEIPTKQGYRFVGWQRSGIGDAMNAEDISFAPYDLNWSITLYAVWTAESYQIIYDAQGGTMPENAVNEWSYEKTVSITAAPTKADALFLGWYESATPSDTDTRVRRLDSSHTAGDVTLYAKWSYLEYPIDALYYSSDGKYIQPAEDDAIPESYKVTDASLTLPTPQSTDVWTFDHWEIINADGSATAATNIDFSKYTGTIKLHAVFNKITYSITYDFNGGSAGAGTYQTSASLGESVYVPTPTRENYHFWGWESDEVGKVANNFTLTSKNAVTLKAKWRTENGYSAEDEAQYQIKYYLSDGMGGWTLSKTSDLQTTYDSVLSVGMMNTEFQGSRIYQFDHAAIDGSSTVYGYYDDLPVTAGNTNVYSVYYSYQTYTVYFMMEHGSVSEFTSKTLHYDDIISAPSANPTKNGYIFSGWDFNFDKEQTVSEWLTSNGTDTQTDIFIYPKEWEQKKYSITYVNWPEGDENPNPAFYTADTPDFNLILPYRKGYTAKEQVVELSGKEEEITVTIEWEINAYNISYDLQGGTVSGTLLTSYTVETAARALPTPTKVGYIFAGWTLSGSNEIVTTVPNKDTLVSYKLKANWTPITYRIIYDFDGGTPEYDLETPPITSYTYDDILAGKVHELYFLEKEGYTFDGWDVLAKNTNTHFQVGNAGIFKLPQDGSDLYVKAVFHMTNCNIVYNLNDSDDTAHPANNPNWKEYFNPSTEDGLLILEPTRTGYVFDGWTCNQKLGSYEAGERMQSIYLDNTNALPKVQLTAHWRAKPYYITYHLNGGSLTTTNKINTSVNENGELIPEAGTVTNPKVYSILNTILLQDPSRTDGIAFLGWTSEQFADIADYTGCELTDAEKQAIYENKPISTATVNKLLNSAALSNYNVHLENLKSSGLVLNALWADETYPIYYNLNGGSLPEGTSNPASYTNLTDTFTLVNPTRTGYTFLGWSIGASNETSSNVTISKGSYGALDFTAKWTVSKYTVSYDLNGGFTNPSADITTEYSTEDLILTFGKPIRPNSTFANWTVKNADTGEILEQNSAGVMLIESLENLCNLVVIANWYSETGIAYADTDGGEWLTTVDGVTQDSNILYPLNTGATIVMLDPEKMGYDFMGWENLSEYNIQITESEVEGCHNIIIPADTSSNGIRLKAIWQANDDTEYHVTYFVRRTINEDYLAMGSTKIYTGTAWDTIPVENLIADVSTAEDVTFMNAAVDGSMLENLTESVIISGDHTTELYLYFEYNIHTVDFVKGTQVGYIRGEAIAEPEDPEWFGHTFDGWFADEDCNIPYDFENAVMGTEDITIYSRWTDNTVEIEYLYWPEEIENPNPTSVIPGSDNFYVVYPASAPDTTGYDYGGLTDEQLATYSYVNTQSTEKIIIETPWKLHEFAITYDCPTTFTYEVIGTQVESYNCKESVVLPTLSAAGHTFSGWTATIGGETRTLTDNTIPVGTLGDITLTAVFDTDVYTISYLGLEDSNFAENNPNPTSYSSELLPITLENPEKDGYTFVGWAADESLVFNPFVLDSDTSGNLELTAKWLANEYTVTVQDGMTYHYTIEDTYSENGIVLIPDERTGYTFIGWNVTDENDTPILIGEDNKLPAGTFGNLTAIPLYEEISYQISYELNEGSFAENGTYPETYKPSETTIIDAPEREGYTFTGWLVDSAYGQFMLGEDGLSGDYGNITLYAGWEDNGGGSSDPDANVFLITPNYDIIAGGAFEIGETVTLKKLTALLPEGYTYAEIVSEYGDSFEAFSVEEYGYYQFMVVRGYAEVTLSATDGINTDIATLYGNGRQMLDSDIYIGAEALNDDYTFDGWYDANDTEFTNCLSDSNWYSFTLTSDVNLVAKFTSISKANVTVTTKNGGAFMTENSSEPLTESIESVQLGSTIVLTAETSEGFLKWEDENGKILGTDTTLILTITHDMTITMVTLPAAEEKATYLEFVGPYAQTLASKVYHTGESLEEFPAIPAMVGYTFRFWSLDGKTEATKADIEATFGTESAVQVKAVYEKNSLTRSITVYVDGALDENLSNMAIPMGENLSLNAPSLDGRTFLYWSLDADGRNIFSYNTALDVKSVADVSVYAIYCDENEYLYLEERPTVVVLAVVPETLGEGENETHKIAVAVSRAIPETYSFVEYGMLYYKDGTIGTEENMLLENSDVQKYTGTNTESTGTLTAHFDMTGNESLPVYARGYIVVMDTATGKLITYYTSITSSMYQEGES